MNKTCNIIGAGLSGCTLAYMLKRKGYNVAIFEADNKIGGLCKDDIKEGIIYNPYGPHIFHTDSEIIWKFVTGFIEMNKYVHRVLTFNKNFYYYPISQGVMKENNWSVEDVYNKFVRNYTEKMWDKKLEELGDDVQKRIRINTGGSTAFFLDKFQGHPKNGYDELFKKLTKGIKIYYGNRVDYSKKFNCDELIVTVPLDSFFSHAFGPLEWRGMESKNILCHQSSFQQAASINYPGKEFEYLRITEFKKISGQDHPWTVIGIDYPSARSKYYPVDTPDNNKRADMYRELARKRGVMIAGRLGNYRYMNMDETIAEAILLSNQL